MNICFILEHFYPQVGGLETEFWEFSTRLAAMGCNVRVITSNSAGVTGAREYNGVRVWHYPWRGLFSHPYPSSSDVREHVEWADVVHTTTYTAAPVARAVSRKYGKPCVLSVQECLRKRWFQLGEGIISASLFYAFERFVVTRSFDAWHCISRATARDVENAGIPRQKVSPILLGIDDALYDSPPPPRDPSELFSVDPSTRVLLFLGRAGKTKGISVLMEAVRLLKDSLPPDVILGLILGAHPAKERERYMRMIESEGLSKRVKIVPSIERARLLEYIRGAYAVIVPSITEGFGFSAAEACALGARVVSSNAGSLPEVVSGSHLFFENRSHRISRRRLTARFEEISRFVIKLGSRGIGPRENCSTCMRPFAIER